MPDKRESLESQIRSAEKLHGHLGPFLVIGVRMGRIAKETADAEHDQPLSRATVRTPPDTPFTCVIDGVQSVTACTVGNQRLKTSRSNTEISAKFELASGTVFDIRVLPGTAQSLIDRLSEGASNEELAAEVAKMPESQLFSFKMPRESTSNRRRLDSTILRDLKIAKSRMFQKGLTLSVVKEGNIVFESASHGISGFLEAIGRSGDRLRDSCVADRITGKAVALLCVYARVKTVSAVTMSQAAKKVFEKNALYFEYDQLVGNVLNRDKTNVCPFEASVAKISNPKEAYTKLKDLQKTLKRR